MSKFEEYEQDYKQDKVRLVTTVQGLQGLAYGKAVPCEGTTERDFLWQATKWGRSRRSTPCSRTTVTWCTHRERRALPLSSPWLQLEMLDSELGALTGSARSAAAARLSGYKSDSADLRERMQVELSAREADDRNSECAAHRPPPTLVSAVTGSVAALFARGDRSGSVEMDPLFNNQRGKLAASSAKLNAARDEMRDTQDVAAGIMTQLEADREKIINIRKNVTSLLTSCRWR